MADSLRHHTRQISTSLRNMIARAVVPLVDDGKNLQLVQLDGFEGGPLDGAEHFQSYGFSSVPLAGAEAVAIFPSGDLGHPLVVAISDRRHRPVGGQPGEVTIYNHTGAKVIIKASGDIEVQPAPGHEVLIRDEGGVVDRVVKRSEFLAHGHATAATGPVSPPTSVAPLPDTGQFPGTQRLRVQ